MDTEVKDILEETDVLKVVQKMQPDFENVLFDKFKEMQLVVQRFAEVFYNFIFKEDPDSRKPLSETQLEIKLTSLRSLELRILDIIRSTGDLMDIGCTIPSETVGDIIRGIVTDVCEICNDIINEFESFQHIAPEDILDRLKYIIGDFVSVIDTLGDEIIPVFNESSEYRLPKFHFERIGY